MFLTPIYVVEEVFYGHRYAVECPKRFAGTEGTLGLPRRLARLLTEHGDVGIEPSVALLDSLQKSVHDLDRREVTSPDPCSEFCSRRKAEFLGHALLLLSVPTAPGGVLVSRARGHNRQNLRMARASISTLAPISSSATFSVLRAGRV